MAMGESHGFHIRGLWRWPAFYVDYPIFSDFSQPEHKKNILRTFS
jgi:hypothetical protein